MADKTINDLTATTSLNVGDLFEIENVSNNSRKITWANVIASLQTTGSWTPVVAFGGSSAGVTYAIQVGRYTRIGNIVTAIAHVQLTNNGSGTGNFTITGLPFTTKNVSNLHQAAACWSLGNPAGKVLGYIADPNTTALRGMDVTNNAAATEADMPDTGEIIINFTYECEP